MTLPLADQVALVTGAGRGVGRAIALTLARAGCRAAILSRTERDLKDAVAEAAADPAAAPLLAVPADVTLDAALELAVRLVIERLGRITVLVNAAGFAPPRDTLLKTALADWDRTLATSLRAPMVLTRLVLPDMLAHGRGTIVSLASTTGKRGHAGEAAYAAASFGLLGFTESLAEEVRDHGIKVTAILPARALADQPRGESLPSSRAAEAVLGVLLDPSPTCPTEILIDAAG
ncbi:MAG: SDR family oxidoreductase [bacterium]